jgi:hypothetical protein
MELDALSYAGWIEFNRKTSLLFFLIYGLFVSMRWSFTEHDSYDVLTYGYCILHDGVLY